MNDAGRIGFVIRGDYYETETYDFLDLVYFKGASYVAKKETMGNEPVHDNEYWHIFSTDINTLQPNFTQSELRENIESGDFLHTILSKIKKWYIDLKNVAFTGNYNDLINTPTSLKNPNALDIKFNGISQTIYDGSDPKEIDVTPSSINAINTSAVLNTVEEIDANTSDSNIAGAQALKAVKDQINSNLEIKVFRPTKSGNCVGGGDIWGFKSNNICIVNFYLEVTKSISTWSAGIAFVLPETFVPTTDGYGLCMAQNSGLSYPMVTYYNNRNGFLLAKGKAISSGDWVWGQVVFSVVP